MRRWQDVGLVLLALLTVALVWATSRSLESSPAATPTTVPDPGDAVGTGAATDPAPTTAAGDAAAVTTGAPRDETMLEEARALLQREERTVVLVLGDSTGNDRGEWTFRWAEALADTRPTWIAPWNEWAEDGYIEPELLGDQAGKGALGEVLVLSGQQTGASAGYAAPRVDLLVPETPDLVILNLGHNNVADDVAEGLSATLEALRAEIDDEVPVLVTLQQPQVGDQAADVRAEVAGWAQEEGLPTIDVAARFLQDEDPDALLLDTVHPNEAGSQVWAEVVAQTLGVP